MKSRHGNVNPAESRLSASRPNGVKGGEEHAPYQLLPTKGLIARYLLEAWYDLRSKSLRAALALTVPK
jgi:hypothetical protein